MLPDITGDKIVWQIRTLQKDTKTKIIVYSAHTKEISKGILNLEERMKELGADEFISKTEGMRKIISRVYERLGMDIKTRVIKKQY
jgi:DNA-binding response OmpR family regulator